MFFPLMADTWGDEEIEAIQGVIASGQYTMAGNVKRFEEAFAAYHGRAHAVMVNSGSSANLIAVAALCHHGERGLRRGDEVIVPAISWSTTFFPLQQYGLRLRFVDIDIDTLGMDTSYLNEALTPRTRAIAGVSILGNPCALDVMRDFARGHDLWFFEDNCESLDARLGGRLTGTFGDVATFSFFFSHHISTMEGGMVLTDDEELCHLARSLRSHGWTRGLPDPSPIYERRESDFFEEYRFILPGYNVRPLEMNAAVGLRQLEKLPAMTRARRKNLSTFQDMFGADQRFIIQKENGESSSFCFTIILAPGLEIEREAVLGALRANEIEHRIITGGNILCNDVMKYFDYDVVGGATPKADLAHRRGFFVGNQPNDLRARIERLHQVLDEVCR
ncbi:MAG: DegT/DnrJ/EryC1/StrS family aminotransferase [Rhodospirillales bacterium]|nr:DegT/DnrJ/EryC1/StrS family aminotransferase [Rhodospirillales bacterium]